MAGPWTLAPHHDPLQYIHHVHLMQQGQNRGCDIRGVKLLCVGSYGEKK